MLVATVVGTSILLLVLGFPLWVALMGGSVLGITFGMNVPFEIVVQQVFGTLDKYVLLAVPGFILTGEILSRTGMAQRLVNWVHSIVGRVPAAMPVTAIGTAEMFGSISGSSPATVSAIGRVLYPALTDRGYDRKFSLGLIASAGGIASLIPPSITMILYASVAEVSLSQLFLAGAVPGLVLGLGLVTYAVAHSIKRGILVTDRTSWARFLSGTKRAALTLLAPVIIFGGIYGGFFTPTEASGIVALYVVVAAWPTLGRFPGRVVWESLKSAALLTSRVFIIVASAGLFAWVLSVGGVPRMIASFVDQMDMPGWTLLLVLNLVFLLAGMFVDPNSATLVLTPFLLPAALAANVDPIHFGVIITLNLAIGMYTPPFGMNLFVTSSILEARSTDVARGAVPFIMASLVALAITTYLPSLSLTLPGWLE